MVQAITNKRDWIGAFFAVTLLAGPALTVAAEDPDLDAQFQEGMDALEIGQVFGVAADPEPVAGHVAACGGSPGVFGPR